ncbi:MAG: TIGR04283 family arsenosugar biosynthesis glycosyltransferase [Alcanivorax sp.]|uniref:TIGR04283 family arsenosugar biosynthesis glycosyltransferase n=1 Tax=Alloalcanivorax marinus TaxID=1177169 RepID=A0A9Q3UQ10_9GAMM|nr:TIGR04283 family arsenosugar biosynthesis glycosyltransferase [Alloalcanivorax marinus]MCC4309382.1 TIGR04283 family arsenosugar biosynthesis glycosyltransferase [Alloalcanivorax marinus]
MSVSVVVPVLDEARCLDDFLAGLRERLGEQDEIIVVDGGSEDGSPLIAREHADLVLHCDRGRARQMNLGAERAKGDWLWFLHADCGRVKRGHLAALRALPEDAQWGRFDVRLSGDHRLFPVIGHAMNLRSRWTGIATGDQGIFVRRELFLELGGFPLQPLMEDVALSTRLRGRARPVCLRPRLVADSRRWEENGVLRTTVLMWQLRWRYWRGEDPARLHRDYYRHHYRQPHTGTR